MKAWADLLTLAIGTCECDGGGKAALMPTFLFSQSTPISSLPQPSARINFYLASSYLDHDGRYLNYYSAAL